MPSPSIFSLLRQAIANAKFESSETRNVVNLGIDSLENADNDGLNPISIEEHPEVVSAIETIQSHLAELLGSPITISRDDNAAAADFGEEEEDTDEIER